MVQTLAGALTTPARFVLYPALHIRWRIIAPYVLLTLAVAAAGTYLITRQVVGSAQDRFNNQLAEAARAASDGVVRRESKHLETVRAIAFTQGVASDVERHDSAALAGVVEPIAANDREEIVEVLDGSGTSVFARHMLDPRTLAYGPLVDASPPNAWPIVLQVLNGSSDARGDKFSGIIETPEGGALYTAGPILDGNRLAGVVLIGTPMTSLASAIKSEVLADVTVYDLSGRVLASTLSPESSANGAELRPDHAPLTQAGIATPVREHKRLSGRDFDLLYTNLAVRGRVTGIYSVALPSSFILSAGAATRREIALIFAAATIAVLITGWLVSRSITEPLFQLARAARSVAGGDLQARSHVGGRDELGQLGCAFDRMTEQLRRQHLSTVRALTSAIDARDPYTMGHSLRVGQLAVEIGKEMGLPESKLQFLEIGGYLHDIGKIGVRDAVLLKPGPLTPEERESIERHPQMGLDILAAVDLAPEVVEFVGSHHEKLNGSGYPRGLVADAMSIVPRIAAVADIYDALTSDRPYREGMGIRKAMEILNREADDGQLDAAVVLALEHVIPRWSARLSGEPALAGFRIGSPNDQQAA